MQGKVILSLLATLVFASYGIAAPPSVELSDDPTPPEPTQPTEAPTEPTEAPTEPTEAPTEPTEAPTEPTVAPTTQSSAPPVPTPANIGGICEALTAFFNLLNAAIPFEAPFPKGMTGVGLPYPAGKVTFDSKATKVEDCVAYNKNGLGTVTHLDITDSLVLHFPQYLIDNVMSEVNITIEKCHVKLHYHVAPIANDAFNRVQMNVILAEITNLGKVNLSVKDGNNAKPVSSDYTQEADDVIRPIIFNILDQFTKQQLQFVVDPMEPGIEGFEALKLVFKSSMYQLHSSLV